MLIWKLKDQRPYQNKDLRDTESLSKPQTFSKQRLILMRDNLTSSSATTKEIAESKDNSEDYSEVWVILELSSRKMSERFILKSHLLFWVKSMVPMVTS